MNPLRLVLVTRRFWPRVGGPEKVTAQLAAELAGRGCRVTVLTAAWDCRWPARITLRGVPVVRLPHPPRPGWRTLRYVRSVARWLRRNQDRCDLVYVSGLKHEAYAALRALRGRVPVVLRAEKAGRRGDCVWQIEARCGWRIKRQCMKAAAFVGGNVAVQRELQAAGYPRPRIHHVADGVPAAPPRTATARTMARSALAAVNSTLQVSDWVPLAVCTGRLRRDKELRKLIAAWRPIVARWPNARLWLAGERSDWAAPMKQIGALNLTGRVLPIGVFDEVDQLLAAADLFVSPAAEGGTPLSLLEAMAAGLPIVAVDSPGNRAAITPGQHGLLVPVADPRAFSDAIVRLIDRPELAARLGEAARERAVAEFSLEKMVDRHQTLFESLIHCHSNTVGA